MRLELMALLVSVVLADTSPVERSPWSVRGLVASRRNAPSTDDERTEAASAFALGEAAYRRGDFEQASKHFHRAYELLPHPSALYNLGMAQARAGDAPSAWNTFDRLANEARSTSDRHDAIAERERLRPSVAFLHVHEPPEGWICLDARRVEVGESGLVVTHPGTHELRIGQSRIPLELRAGEAHTVDLETHATLDRVRRPSRAIVPLLATTGVSAGVATGLGIAASVPNTGPRRELTAGAATASGIALATAVAALVLHARARSDKRRRPPTYPQTDCPG